MNTRCTFEPEIFGGFPKGHRYGLWIRPDSAAVRGTILCIQTPGEENNLCRRLMVKAASRFAERGFVVLLFDPFGVGDSAGETAEARLQDWRRDLLAISMKLRLKYDAPFYVWGVRLGTLLAADFMISQSDNTDGLLMWAPLAHGRTWVDQQVPGQTFSRLIKSLARKVPFEATANRISKSRMFREPASVSPSLDMAVDPGDVVIAGTTYKRSLVQELLALSLNPVKLQPGFSKTPAALFLGISQGLKGPGGEPACPPSLQAMATNWHGAGYRVKAEGVAEPLFWANQKIVEPLTLFESSEKWLETTLQDH